jgi:hypothetical protein
MQNYIYQRARGPWHVKPYLKLGVVGSPGWEKNCRTSNFEEISRLILAATIPLKLKMVVKVLT